MHACKLQLLNIFEVLVSDMFSVEELRCSLRLNYEGQTFYQVEWLASSRTTTMSQFKVVQMRGLELVQNQHATQ